MDFPPRARVENARVQRSLSVACTKHRFGGSPPRGGPAFTTRHLGMPETARMASFAAIYSVGNSIAQYLQNAYPPALASSFPCQFKLVSSTQIAMEDQTALDQVLSIFLHRITMNENFRSATRLQDVPSRQPTVFLD